MQLQEKSKFDRGSRGLDEDRITEELTDIGPLRGTDVRTDQDFSPHDLEDFRVSPHKKLGSQKQRL